MRKWEGRGGVLDGAGALTLDYGEVPRGEEWLFERITFETDSAASPVVEIRVGEYLGDRSSGLTVNIADEASPVFVPSGNKLFVVVSGGTAGAVFHVDAQYDLRREESSPTRQGPPAQPITGLRPGW